MAHSRSAFVFFLDEELEGVKGFFLLFKLHGAIKFGGGHFILFTSQKNLVLGVSLSTKAEDTLKKTFEHERLIWLNAQMVNVLFYIMERSQRSSKSSLMLLHTP